MRPNGQSYDKSVIGYTDLRSVHQRVHQETASLIDKVTGALLNRVSGALDARLRALERSGHEYLKIGLVFTSGALAGAIATLMILFLH